MGPGDCPPDILGLYGKTYTSANNTAFAGMCALILPYVARTWHLVDYAAACSSGSDFTPLRDEDLQDEPPIY
ncbi:hypothetical protein [Pyrobaculum aerophilum]|uniref:hypothetical protein n=1 Tax=Pyrobaculum aerophilum TaxID=13773 RepID=UPI0011C0290C|nr:hypothetical protein [Pyrobaculum aerophilum]